MCLSHWQLLVRYVSVGVGHEQCLVGQPGRAQSQASPALVGVT